VNTRAKEHTYDGGVQSIVKPEQSSRVSTPEAAKPGPDLEDKTALNNARSLVSTIARAKGIEINDVDNLRDTEIKQLIKAGVDPTSLVRAGAGVSLLNSQIEAVNNESEAEYNQKLKQFKDEHIELIDSQWMRKTSVRTKKETSLISALRTCGQISAY
jgi:hypothetical protein